MLAFIAENMPTILGSIVILAVFISIIAKQIYNKGGCGAGCSGCPNSQLCHPKNDG